VVRFQFGCLLVASLLRFFRHVQLGGGPGEDPEHPGGIIETLLAWERLRIPPG